MARHEPLSPDGLDKGIINMILLSRTSSSLTHQEEWLSLVSPENPTHPSQDRHIGSFSHTVYPTFPTFVICKCNLTHPCHNCQIRSRAGLVRHSGRVHTEHVHVLQCVTQRTRTAIVTFSTYYRHLSIIPRLDSRK